MPLILRPAKLVLFNVTPSAKVGALMKVTSSNLDIPATYNFTVESILSPAFVNALEFPIPSLSTFTSKISAEALTKPNCFHLLLVLSYTSPI